MSGRVTVVKKVSPDLLQKVLMKAVELANQKYVDITGQPLSMEQREFLVATISKLTDTVITAVRTGKLKPNDVAQLLVGQALDAVGIARGDSAAGNYLHCGLALLSLAIATSEMYGVVVTASAAAAVSAPATGGLSVAADAGVVVVGILYWNYLVLDATMTCAGDFRKIEDRAPAWMNVPSLRAASTNACVSQAFP